MKKSISVETYLKFQITEYDTSRVHFLDNIPDKIKFTVTMQGSDFIRYYLTSKPVISVDFSDYCESNSEKVIITTDQLSDLIREGIGYECAISNLKPGSLSISYSDLPGKKVPVHLESRIEPNFKYAAYGEIKLSRDSVMIYSDKNTLNSINSVSTYLVQLKDLTDTLRREVFIKPIKGVKIEPRSVHMMVPIEPLVFKKKIVPIQLVNVPSDLKLIVFPSSIQVTYLVPKSLYERNINDIHAVVDYNMIDRVSKSNYVTVNLYDEGHVYKNVSSKVDSVEYIIEKQL